MEKTISQRLVEEHHFTTHDGVELFYRHWPARSGNPRGAIVLFHRGHEHSGRVAHLVDELQMDDYDYFAWDARGHGLSPGERGFSPDLSDSVRDVHTFIEHIVHHHAHAHENIAVIAQSVGAVLVSTWVHDYAPRIRCMVLASPAFKIKLYVPFAYQGLKLLQSLRGPFFVNSYVKAKYLSHDPERIASYEQDPLISRPIASHILLSLNDTAKRIVEDAAAITLPTQLLVSGDDWVVHQAPQHRFYERLGSLHKQRHILKGFYHDTLGEKERALALEKVRTFLMERFAQPCNQPDLSHADLHSYTRQESDILSSPLPRFSLRSAYWALTRRTLRMAGRLSAGVQLGHVSGFDSGSTLDYVYENKPRGRFIAGAILDRFYLNSIGWRGIRQRKRHVEELIRLAAEYLHTEARPLHILDVAAGHGRYLLEAMETVQRRPDSITLRDYSDLNVTQGRQLITQKGLDEISTFNKADAFATDSYASFTHRPTLGVVSGLYELFPDNDVIRASLQGFAQSIDSGGYLIYTNQPWHPQLEMIARALTSHRNGEAWVMRRRSQLEMDQLVTAAGFTKVEQRIDPWGIFTVSLARKN